MCHCVNNRVGYLHRILGDRPDLLSCFQRFDTSVDETLCQILQVSDTESNIRQVSVIRSLPQARGGLGINYLPHRSRWCKR